jgi:hypothetical protein
MRTEQCNRVQVERYYLGEALAGEKAAIRKHMDGCEECRGHMATLENDKRAYLIEHPFREFAARRLDARRLDGHRLDGKHASEGKAESRRWFSPRWLPAFAGLAACLALVPVVMRYNGTAAGDTAALAGDDVIRTKGGTLLEYYVKRGETVTPGSAADAYRLGDELQFVYAADKHPFVTLASMDARGKVSLYKADGAEALSLAAIPGGEHPLPFAVTLDDSPGAEFFVMIYSPGPMAGEAVESWLKEAFTRASGNLEGMASLLAPPPGPGPGESGAAGSAGTPGDYRVGSEIKTLLIRKTRV